MSEVRNFHPLVKTWLEDNGFTDIEHHKPMPGHGIADFYAADAEGRRVIIECKSNRNGVNSAIRQVLGYVQACQTAYGVTHIGAIAAPAELVTDRIIGNCQSVGVQIVSIDTDADEGQPRFDPVLEQWHQENAVTLAFVDQLRCKPQQVIDSVVSYHLDNETSPLADLIILRKLALSNFEAFKNIIPVDEDKRRKLDAAFIGVIMSHCSDMEETIYAEMAIEYSDTPSFFKQRFTLRPPTLAFPEADGQP